MRSIGRDRAYRAEVIEGERPLPGEAVQFVRFDSRCTESSAIAQMGGSIWKCGSVPGASISVGRVQGP